MVGLTLSLAALVSLTGRVRDARRRTLGMRICHAGMGMMSLGGILFVLSRPADLLPDPLDLFVVGVFVAFFLGSLRWLHS